VAHSIGGLLVRSYLQRWPMPQLGNVVMIATPSQGSEFVAALERLPGAERMFGPLLLAMGTEQQDLPANLPRPDYAVGVIAGSRTHSPLGWLLLPGLDDGAVTVSSTHFEGMSDFVVIRANHFQLRHDPRVFQQVLHFLQRGQFAHEQLAAGL
jgi:hypothetical protein